MYTLADALTYPEDVFKYFKNGEWTVSVKGRPFHNIALHEAHESIVNRKLKQITSRPSHFRMVELAVFKSYLENTLSSFDSYVLQYTSTTTTDKKAHCVRAGIIYDLITPHCLFQNPSQPRCLCNVFASPPPALDHGNVKDLLSISKIGNERMLSFVRQYVLTPPNEIRQKRRRQKLRTFTPVKASTRQLNSKLKQVSLLLSKAYRSLMSPGSGFKQTYPFPLALCSPNGTIRPRSKSTFRDVVLSVLSGVPGCTSLSHDPFITTCSFFYQSSFRLRDAS